MPPPGGFGFSDPVGSDHQGLPGFLERISELSPLSNGHLAPICIMNLCKSLPGKTTGMLADCFEYPVADEQRPNLVGMGTVVVNEPIGASCCRPDISDDTFKLRCQSLNAF